MVEEALLEKMDETVAQGWVYRKDPDSKYHYFCNRSQMRPDLTKGMEATTGWDTQSQQNGGVGKSRGKTDDASMAAAAAAVTGEDISSQWKHPLSKKYKTLLATRRKELDEERRMKRVRGLRAKSSTLHCAKINQGRSAGRQAIVKGRT